LVLTETGEIYRIRASLTPAPLWLLALIVKAALKTIS